MRATYTADSTAKNKNALSDPYVKFFRWATDRLGKQDGIVCFVSNNSFVDQIAFDGMRKHLLKDFTRVYHLHLEGNVRENPKLAGTTYNVFGIQVGVGITIAVRCAKHTDQQLYFQRVDKNLRRLEKLAVVADWARLGGVPWESLQPDAKHTWLVAENAGEFDTFLPLCHRAGRGQAKRTKKAVFELLSLGVKTNRDKVVYNHDRKALSAGVTAFSQEFNAEVDRYKRSGGGANVDTFVRYDTIKWSETLKAHLSRGHSAQPSDGELRTALFRPFCKQVLCFNDVLVERRYQFPHIFPTTDSERENRVIAVSDIGYRANCVSALMSDRIVDLHLCATLDAHQCFPFYVYDEDGSNRQENVTDWALKQYRSRYSDRKLTKWDVFHYVYGLLHHPGYRAKFADNLKKSLPRIPFAPDFRAFAAAGKQLADLHVGYEAVEPWPLRFVWDPARPTDWRVEKMALSKDKTRLTVNPSLTLAELPAEAFEYRLGNRSALEWVIDQYRVTEDKRTGVRSDPNRPDDERHVVDLVGKVVRVSVETVRLVKALPAEFTSPARRAGRLHPEGVGALSPGQRPGYAAQTTPQAEGLPAGSQAFSLHIPRTPDPGRRCFAACPGLRAPRPSA